MSTLTTCQLAKTKIEDERHLTLHSKPPSDTQSARINNIVMC